MKKIYLVLIWVLVIIGPSYGQYNINENKVWAFGNHAGLDFTSGSPVAITTSIDAIEGCASVSDTSGNLLFYTEGMNVYDKAGTLMPSGVSIVAFPPLSTAQGAAIVPMIGNANKYYVFSLQEAGGRGYLAYSVIDMTLNSGLGDVEATARGIMIDSGFSEQMTVVSGNSNNIWVMVHKTPTKKFYAYSVTSSGLSSAPVISTTGTLVSPIAYSSGVMKVAHGRNKIVTACIYGLELYDFNATTGVVSNCQVINDKQTYGAEFSPDDTKLYIQQLQSTSGTYQLNVSLSTTADIIASKTLLHSSYGQTDLKLGPDGKIYLDSDYYSASIACITAPNITGTGCNFVGNYMSLAAGTKTFVGFPSEYIRYVPVTTAVQGVKMPDAVIKAIPNPSRGAFTVTGTLGSITNEQVSLEMTDMIGQVVYKGDATVKGGKLNTEVQLSNTIASGTYLLNVRSGAMHKVFHIIIEQ